MNSTYRPPTIEERFFGHTTIVNVPVSVPPENLPETYTAPVDTTPLIPDLIRSNNNTPTTLSKVGTFMSKNWGYILVGVIIVGSVYWYNQRQKENKKKSLALNKAGTQNTI